MFRFGASGGAYICAWGLSVKEACLAGSHLNDDQKASAAEWVDL